MTQHFPSIVGIVNVTPDSFSDGGLYAGADDAIAHGERLIAQGASMLDIGGESTRPGAVPLSTDEECVRVVPVVRALRERFPELAISIDTRSAAVAREAIDAGANVLNDVSAGLHDPSMLALAAERNLPIILMHMQGTPQTMQREPQYEHVSREVFDFLHDRIVAAHAAGVRSVIADVGIGFGKTIEHNIQLLREHQAFKHLGVPLMLGISRKRFLGALCGIEKAADRDPVTAMMHALLINCGADYIRVHNVELLVQLKKLWTALR